MINNGPIFSAGFASLLAGFLTGCHSPFGRTELVAQSAPSSIARNSDSKQVGVIVDIDETISVTDYPSLFFGIGRDESRPHERAVDVLRNLSRDFDVTYLTARPQWLTGETRQWLTKAGFPRGRVLTTARMLDVYWPGSFKKRGTAALRRAWPNLLIGIGDRPTDIEGYIANGMLALVVNPRRGITYHQRAKAFKDWRAVGAFFEEHEATLRDPEALRATYGAGGVPLDPSTVRARPEIDLSLIAEIPLLGPTLLIESLAKMGLVHHQMEAERALALQKTPFNEALQKTAARFGNDTLLKLRLETEHGEAAYTVSVEREGRVHQLRLDASLKPLGELKQVVSLTDRPVPGRHRLQITFPQALAISMRQIEAQPYEIELEIDDGRPTYETAMAKLGRFLEVEVDAETGEVIEIEDETAIE